MKTKTISIVIILLCFTFLISCGGDSKKEKKETKDELEDEMDDEELEDEYDDEEELSDEELEDEYDDEEELSDEESEEDEESTSATDLDEFLDNYEDYVNSYIKIAKKAQKGDATAIQELPALLESANELQSNLEEEMDNFTTTQASRFSKIQAKLMQAASGM